MGFHCGMHALTESRSAFKTQVVESNLMMYRDNISCALTGLRDRQSALLIVYSFSACGSHQTQEESKSLTG